MMSGNLDLLKCILQSVAYNVNVRPPCTSPQAGSTIRRTGQSHKWPDVLGVFWGVFLGFFFKVMINVREK